MAKRRPPKPGKDSALKRLREAAGLSQQELASLIGVGVATISRWERGASPAMLSVPQMKALCRELGVALNDLPDDFGPIEES